MKIPYPTHIFFYSKFLIESFFLKKIVMFQYFLSIISVSFSFWCLCSISCAKSSVNVFITQIDADDEIIVMLHKHIVVDYQQKKVCIS